MFGSETRSIYAFGPYRLTPEKRLLCDGAGHPIALRGKVFDLLWYLIQHRGRLVEKSELLDALWPGTIVEENNLNQAISALRQALGDDAKTPEYIATIKGRGYQFVGEVKIESDSPVVAAAGERTTRRSWVLPTGAAATVLVLAALAFLNRDPEPKIRAVPVSERFANARLQLVTDFNGSHTAPTLSPDGRMMAYVSDAGGTPQIWIKNLERGDPIRITRGPYPASSPTWSPKDDQILFARRTPSSMSIFSVGTLGTPGPRPAVDSGASPKYAMQTDAFVYARGSQIWIAHNDGRDREKIIGTPVSQGFAAREPALSPDGKLVAFIHADEGPLGNLWLIPASGGTARQLTTRESGGGYAGAPTWSPDGRSIVYHVNADTSGSHLWQVAVDSGKASALTSGSGGAANPVLSSDGKRLAYTTTRSMWRLSKIDVQSAERSTVFESRTQILLPIASQDGKTIVFFSMQPSGMQLFTIGSDGQNLRQLTFDERGENALPTWAGDGKSILYYRGRSLHRLNPADGSDEKVFADFHWSSKNWLDASRDRISFHDIDRPTGSQRTVVGTIGESEEIELPVPIEAAQWSRDGEELIGFYRQSGEILICQPGAPSCQNIDVENETLKGSHPTWSKDGEQIYYLRQSDVGECCVLWRIDRDGSDKRRVADLTDFDHQNSYFGFDANGDIFYNHVDRSSEEIWLAIMEE